MKEPDKLWQTLIGKFDLSENERGKVAFKNVQFNKKAVFDRDDIAGFRNDPFRRLLTGGDSNFLFVRGRFVLFSYHSFLFDFVSKEKYVIYSLRI